MFVVVTIAHAQQTRTLHGIHGMTSNLYAIGFVVSLLAGAAGLYYLFSGMAASPESAEELDLQQPEAVTAESSTSSGVYRAAV